MKKIFSFLALAIVAFGFSACEDIPSPYEIIEDIIDGPEEETVAPVGDGTAATPFNVAGIIDYCKSLGADVNSEKEVYFTGIVTRFKDGEEPGNSYGNATFWISDTGSEADEFYCFRCYGPGNKKFTSADQMKVGDKVTLCAKVVNYKGNTPETVQGSAYVALVGDGTIEGGNDGPAADPVGDGTQASPYNVTAALNYTSSLAADTESAPVYVKGIVCDDPDIDTGNYGNATFHISDNGENSNSFYCFRVMDFGGKKFTSANFKKGDEVVITGPLVNYKGNTPETVANKCSLYSVNGKTAGGNTDTPSVGAKGSGTEADPFNVAGVIAYTSALAADVNSDKEVYFTGVVKNFKSGEEPGNSYGNATFYVVDEGGSDEFYCFRVLGKDGKKFTEGAEAPAVGDKVTIRGLVVNYKGNTPETVTGKAYVESIVKGEGGDNTGGDNGDNTGGDPVVVGNTVKYDLTTLGLANQTSVDGQTFTIGGADFKFDKGTGSTPPAYYTSGGFNSVRVYACNNITITAPATIKNVVFNTTSPASGTKYNGNTTSTTTAGTLSWPSDQKLQISGVNATNFVYCNFNSEGKGGVQLRVQSIEIEYVDAASARRAAQRARRK